MTNNDEKNSLSKILSNDVVEINVISQLFVVVLNFQFIDDKLSASHCIITKNFIVINFTK